MEKIINIPAHVVVQRLEQIELDIKSVEFNLKEKHVLPETGRFFRDRLDALQVRYSEIELLLSMSKQDNPANR